MLSPSLPDPQPPDRPSTLRRLLDDLVEYVARAPKQWIQLAAALISTFGQLAISNQVDFAQILEAARNVTLPLEWKASIGVVLAAIISGALFLLRKHLRRIYASLEVGIGLVTAWNVVYGALAATSIDKVEVFIKGAAAIYVVVRGMDNYEKGQEEADKARAERAKAAA